MGLTIGEAAERTGVSIYTLRYYEKEGILPAVTRNESGIRMYETKDIEAVELIGCLRAIGMTISDIKQFVQEHTVEQRLAVLERQKEIVQSQMDQLAKYQAMIDRKITLYRSMR
ncbi:MerR family transcriptional regulator [Paenibacillus sp. P26]|nr:MerR family transcriptional regulator [Paenibacillus sp. P26]UUZ90970.1 MerR family transcriptional regulator [Paenibacillus sp. P25]